MCTINLNPTIFLTTHYMEDAESLCDRIFLNKDGKKVTEGTAKIIPSADSFKKYVAVA